MFLLLLNARTRQGDAHHGLPLEALAPSPLAGHAAAWPLDEAFSPPPGGSQGGRRGTRQRHGSLVPAPEKEPKGAQQRLAFFFLFFSPLCCFIFGRATVSWRNRKLPGRPARADSEEACVELAAFLTAFLWLSPSVSLAGRVGGAGREDAVGGSARVWLACKREPVGSEGDC